MTTQNKQRFIARTRRLAATFVSASDTFNALAAELRYSGYEEAGALTAEDFIGANEGLTPEALFAFYTTLQELLGPLTDEQKKTIYALKGSDGSELPSQFPFPVG